jgi:divalent metal cation (Fe/Co/Zn/Cd) transporter
VKLTGLVVLDPLIAIAVAVNILRVGWRLLRGAVGGLMDEADESLLTPICRALDTRREAWWIDVHSLRTWRSGAIQHTDLHLAVPRYFDADRLHGINHRVAEVILGATGRPGDVIVHFDPCRPRQCASCAVSECPVREKAFEALEAISLESALRGDEQLETGEPLPHGTLE